MRLAYGLLAVGVVYSFFAALRQFLWLWVREGDTGLPYFGSVATWTGFAIWLSVPYLLLAVVFRASRVGRTRYWSTWAVVSALLVLGIDAVYLTLFVLFPDPQTGIGYFGLPPLQFAVILVALGVSMVVPIWRRMRRGGKGPQSQP